VQPCSLALVEITSGANTIGVAPGGFGPGSKFLASEVLSSRARPVHISKMGSDIVTRRTLVHMHIPLAINSHSSARSIRVECEKVAISLQTIALQRSRFGVKETAGEPIIGAMGGAIIRAIVVVGLILTLVGCGGGQAKKEKEDAYPVRFALHNLRTYLQAGYKPRPVDERAPCGRERARGSSIRAQSSV